jgi:hypothetical protein
VFLKREARAENTRQELVPFNLTTVMAGLCSSLAAAASKKGKLSEMYASFGVEIVRVKS